MAPVVHILAIPLPFQGHINPILHILSRISSPNLVTTLLMVEQYMPRIQRSLHGNPHVRLKPIPTSVIDVEKMTGLPSVSQLFYALDAFEKSLDSLVEVIESLHLEQEQGTPITCLFTDVFLQMGQDLANKLQVPRVAMWTSGAASFLVSFSLKTLISEGVLSQTPPESLHDLESPVNCIPGLENIRKGDLPLSILYPGAGEHQKRMLTFSRTHEAACVLFNTVEEVDRNSIDAMKALAPEPKFLAVGPLLPSSFLKDLGPGEKNVISHGEGLWKEDVDCLSWLDQQKPGSVLYVSFGSMANLSAEQFEQLAAGIESSQQPFLWVLRPNLVSDVLPNDFLEKFTERTKPRGLVIAWAPQLQVLKHAAVGGFLTHCGWNSTLEAMSSGVPMLGWPCFAEQTLNCKLVVDVWRVGLTFRRSFEGVVDKAELERVIRLLMVDQTGKEIRKRAMELRDVMRNSVEPGGSSHRNLHTFVDLFSHQPPPRSS